MEFSQPEIKETVTGKTEEYSVEETALPTAAMYNNKKRYQRKKSKGKVTHRERKLGKEIANRNADRNNRKRSLKVRKKIFSSSEPEELSLPVNKPIPLGTRLFVSILCRGGKKQLYDPLQLHLLRS